jgi:serine/threonine protein kinase
LTGRPPFEFASLAELAAKQGSGAVIPVRDLEPNVPEALEEVLMRCLAHDARFRYGSAAELRSALQESLTPSRDDTAPTRRLPARPRRLVGSRNRLWLVAAAVLAAVGLSLGLSRLGGNGGRHARPPTVAAIPRGKTPAAEAHNLSAWLRAQSLP